MMLHGVRSLDLIEAHEVIEGGHGVAFIFRTNDGGRCVLYLDRSEIEQRAYEFEPPRHAPQGAQLQ